MPKPKSYKRLNIEKLDLTRQLGSKSISVIAEENETSREIVTKVLEEQMIAKFKARQEREEKTPKVLSYEEAALKCRSDGSWINSPERLALEEFRNQLKYKK